MASVEYVEHSHCQWLELHPDLLNKIMKFIYSARDYVRARATCKTWNLELPKVPKQIKGPWLVLALDEDTFDVKLKTISSQLKVPHLRMPELKSTLLRGSCFGWLFSVGLHDTLQVSNPFTKSHFNLPPISTFPHVVSYQPDAHEYTLDNEFNMDDSYIFDDVHVQKFYISKIVSSCSPDHKKNFMAVAIYGEFCSLAYYKFGDKKWTHIPTTNFRSMYDDVTFHEGKIYAIAHRGGLYEFDMKTFERFEIMPPHKDVDNLCSGKHRQYLIWNPDGVLLLLIRHWEYYPHHKVRNEKEVKQCYKTSKFDIYKLNRSEKQWSKESNLGDYVIVVGFNSSIWMQPFSDDEGNWVKNCIYYSDDKYESHYTQVIGGHEVGVFNLQDETINQLFPNSDFLYPPPVWVLHP